MQNQIHIPNFEKNMLIILIKFIYEVGLGLGSIIESDMKKIALAKLDS